MTNDTNIKNLNQNIHQRGWLTLELKAAQGAQGQGDAAHVAGLRQVGEAGGGQLVGQALGHAGVAQRLVHQHQGQHLQQAVLDVLLQLRDLPAQVVQHGRQGRAGGA